MQTDLSTISFDAIWQNIRRSIAGLNKEAEHYHKITPDHFLKKLLQVTEEIGKEPVPVPQFTSEFYKKQWNEFVSGIVERLSRRTVRNLCWDSDIALNPDFVHYIERSNITLTPQSIYALIRSCHMKWSTELAESQIIAKIRKIVLSYSGPNHLINKWRKNIKMVIGVHGTLISAKEMLNRGMSPDDFFEEWGIDVQSEFAWAAIRLASNICLQKLGMITNHNDYLIKSLLPWEGWDLAVFKKEIESSILDKNIKIVREQFQSFVLGDKRLGDPRQPRNTNWLGVKEEAKKKFISWLSRRDIVFFFVHVLPKGKDPHGRKDFWLQYVNSLVASRPLLCEQDRYLLRTQLQEEQIDYGLISGTNSAFILDFGTIVAVEFSKVGACYIYSKNDFNKIIPNLFHNRWFLERDLKRGELSDARIVHRLTTNCDWRNDITTVLARYGIRKG